VDASKEVTMSESPLSKYAGPIAVIAGGLFAVVHVGQFLVMDRSDLVAMMKDPNLSRFQRRLRHHASVVVDRLGRLVLAASS
jgi:hypothetical protein